jgi:alpha-galactosidase
VIRFLFPAVLMLALSGMAADDREILTPKPGPAPKINGPRLYGARPGRPFLYRIPCTGTRPIEFSAKGLPAGLTLDGKTGIISGRTPEKRGEHKVALRARNGKGSAQKVFTIVVGDQLALTPPMGWNHWYTHYDRITEKLMRQAADVMISSGMADMGYQYVSIDDCWMIKPGSPDPNLTGPERDASGAILSNKYFPDMKALTSYIHGKGLKAGTYTSPGPLTCAKFVGSYQHEEADARRFAEWGFDFLKYDWCSYGKIAKDKSLEEAMKPYTQMGGLVAKQERDMLFNLCQYGNNDVWKWGAKVGGHAWRTTGDLGLEKDTRLPGFYSIAFKNMQHAEYAKPGNWNDPDYILIGVYGDAKKKDAPPRQTTLTGHEQYSYMSLWALMASPLFFSGDMGRVDEFTLNVLNNAEVIGINQDALGKQARVVRKTDDELVMAKPLEDGSVALGLFNLSEEPRTVAAKWTELAVSGKKRVRDLWRQSDTGTAEGEYSAKLARHGVMLVTLRRP